MAEYLRKCDGVAPINNNTAALADSFIRTSCLFCGNRAGFLLNSEKNRVLGMDIVGRNKWLQKMLSGVGLAFVPTCLLFVAGIPDAELFTGMPRL